MSKYLLFLTVSPSGDNSKSRSLAGGFLDSFKAAHPDVEIKTRDLSVDPVPHLDGETIFYAYTPEDKRSPSQIAKHEARLALANELIGASYVVVATPMWNWGPPSVLKAYIDQIVIVGVLDPYTQKHLAGKPVTVLIAAGGSYTEKPEADHESNYIAQVFTYLGSTDVTVIRTELTLAGVVPGMEALVPKKDESYKVSLAAAVARAAAI